MLVEVVPSHGAVGEEALVAARALVNLDGMLCGHVFVEHGDCVKLLWFGADFAGDLFVHFHVLLGHSEGLLALVVGGAGFTRGTHVICGGPRNVHFDHVLVFNGYNL